RRFLPAEPDQQGHGMRRTAGGAGQAPRRGDLQGGPHQHQGDLAMGTRHHPPQARLARGEDAGRAGPRLPGGVCRRSPGCSGDGDGAVRRTLSPQARKESALRSATLLTCSLIGPWDTMDEPWGCCRTPTALITPTCVEADMTAVTISEDS